MDGFYDEKEIRETFIQDIGVHVKRFTNIMLYLLDEVGATFDHKEFIKDTLSLRYIAR